MTARSMEQDPRADLDKLHDVGRPVAARRIITAGVVTLALVAGVVALGAGARGNADRPPTDEQRVEVREQAERRQASADAAGERVLGTFYERVTAATIEEYAGRVFAGHVDALAAELNRQAAEAVARSAAAAVTRPRSSGGGAPVSGACGGSKYDYVMDEESGQPNEWNTQGSGAWGCYQIMPGTWAGAGCNELGQHGSASPAAQAACADRLSPGDWAASQGG